MLLLTVHHLVALQKAVQASTRCVRCTPAIARFKETGITESRPSQKRPSLLRTVRFPEIEGVTVVEMAFGGMASEVR